MVNEKLRTEMSNAYANGDYKKALRLSRQLDKQILEEYKTKQLSKNHKKKTLSMEI